MSKIMNYLKKNQNDILLAMMGANSLLPGANANQQILEQLRSQR